MIEIAQILNRYYLPGEPITVLLWRHSQQVATLATKIAHNNPHLHIDLTFLHEAAMLHDIGVFRTNAPSIYCHGNAQYIQHGIIGAELLRAEGLEAHARVCECHIGVGLSIQDIIEQNLPLPHRDMLPETLEEKLVCYADNFFSKSQPDVQRTFTQVRNSIARFGNENVERFDKLAQLFGKIDD
ncbi:MAG: HDIG domain-containing protein [Bacteroidaceae bacterium]|nr:HDIG domain-containing protein [Bacteroidaceae bacterium]